MPELNWRMLKHNNGLEFILQLRQLMIGWLLDGLAEGKDLIVTGMYAMGKEQIRALKDIGPK